MPVERVLLDWSNLNVDPLMLAIWLIAGALLGSFATMMVHRIPREIPLGLFPPHHRSICPQCEKVIPWYRNIPILGFLMGRGRCSHCQKKIPIRYLVIEITTCLLFGFNYVLCENSPLRPGEDLGFYLDLFKNQAFTLALITTFFIDIDFRIIPDRFSLGGWVVALIFAGVVGSPPFLESLLGGLLGFGLFFGMALFYLKWKKIEGLGMGDVKMMGWVGSWVGFFAVPFVILFASITGLIAGLLAMRHSKEGLRTAIPFGPFIALGTYFCWVLLMVGFW